MHGLTSSITAGCSRATKQPCSSAQAATSMQTSGDAPEVSLENARLTLRRASNLLSLATGVESTLNSLQTSNRSPPTTLYFLVFCYAPAGISLHQKRSHRRVSSYKQCHWDSC